jgi:hypothetical protein
MCSPNAFLVASDWTSPIASFLFGFSCYLVLYSRERNTEVLGLHAAIFLPYTCEQSKPADSKRDAVHMASVLRLPQEKSIVPWLESCSAMTIQVSVPIAITLWVFRSMPV